MTIEEFIGQRLAEDEDIAAGARRGPRSDSWAEDYGREFLVVSRVEAGIPECDVRSTAESQHIARHDPARVLRQCAMMRVALGWYINDDEMVMGATIQAIAAIWSDHPDYQQDWDDE